MFLPRLEILSRVARIGATDRRDLKNSKGEGEGVVLLMSITESSIARMAGNIAAGFLVRDAEQTTDEQLKRIAEVSVVFRRCGLL